SAGRRADVAGPRAPGRRDPGGRGTTRLLEVVLLQEPAEMPPLGAAQACGGGDVAVGLADELREEARLEFADGAALGLAIVELGLRRRLGSAREHRRGRRDRDAHSR